MKILLSILLYLAAGVRVILAAQLPAGFTEQLVAENLDPTDMVSVPDGRIFITIKSGKILVIEDGALRPSPLLNIAGITDNYNERGLGHIVLDPGFVSNGYYYVYYTVKGQSRNRVSRFTALGNFSSPSSELVLLDLDIMSGTVHNAGDMVFGHDGKLYVSVGDGADASKAQSLNSLLGKILRIDKDGSIPVDNPFYNSTTGKYRSIWALGLRNPFSMDVDPESGKIFACDVGGSSWEEVNDIEGGKNYGWPSIEGKRTNQALPVIGAYKDPLYAYSHDFGSGGGCAIVGAAFYHPDVKTFPSDYHGKFFYADYCNGNIYALNTGNATTAIFVTNINRPLAIIVTDEGTMYYLARSGVGGGSEQDNTASTDGTLWKVEYTGSGAPFISVQPKSVVASVGESATFRVMASGSDPIAYQWEMNGIAIPGANANSYAHANAELAEDGAAFTCVISNTHGQVVSAAGILTVTLNTRPVPGISWSLPGSAVKYKAGQTISFNGAANDTEDGNLPASALSWKIEFHHGAHSHPALSGLNNVSSGTYTIPKVGETSADVWFRISLTATDQGDPALSATAFADIHPLTTSLTLATEPTGLSVTLDGQPVATPYIFSSVMGSTRELSAATQLHDGGLYRFDHWENGSAQIFSFDTPETATTYKAIFVPVPAGDGEGLKGQYYSNQLKGFNPPAAMARTDAVVNFNWGVGAPAANISVDKFSVRWTGYILPQFSDEYTFYVTADDGIRLWVNEQWLIDKWIDQGPTEWSGKILLTAGEMYPIKLDYYENGGGALVKLEWRSNNLPREVIPASQMFTSLITSLDHEARHGVVIYPTIAEDRIEVLNLLPQSTWRILNLTGQQMKSGNSLFDSFTIDVQSLPAGIYLLQTRMKTVRFVKR